MALKKGFWDKMKGLGQFGANKVQQFGQNIKNKAQQFGAEANDYMQTANMKGEIQNAIQTIEKLLQNQTIVNGYTDRNGNQYKVNVNGLRMGLSSLNKALAMFNNTQQNNQNQ
jgi:phosphoribosylformylglycinamidine (FGAM) synthase-like amidotransferase family enzyme